MPLAAPPRILLFGIYDIGHRALAALLARGLHVVGVVTKPEGLLEEHPVVRLARESGTPVLGPESPREAGFLREVRALAPELIVVAGYHKILPPRLLALAPRGALNLHGSLLPRYRGPCPWKWAILDGETRTGATVQMLTEELDRGDILAQRELEIDPDDNGESLFLRISALAGPLIADTVEAFLAGRIEPRPQDERVATYQGYPGEEDRRIRWEWSAGRIRDRVRGLCPRPGAWTQHAGRRIEVRAAALADGAAEGSPAPGTIVGRSEDALVVATGRGRISLPLAGLTLADGGDAALEAGTSFDRSPG